ncbi:aldehyde dehydrogenase family protein [Sphingobium aquiterrae]|uniref:aldehyde dehydrogenase family protein n=1 Tax=Sphingobium aquiterrae TaxID=2038656 RepID=UPI0030163FFE
MVHALIDPADATVHGTIALGACADVDRAVQAAKRALPQWARTSVAERIALLRRIEALYVERIESFASAVTLEMGAPISLSRGAQAPVILMTLGEMIRVLESYAFEEERDGMLLMREPVGICGLITPWNWPLHQLALKVVPALAAGCAMVVKPSEFAPLSALLFAQLLADAGVPPGVFNLVNGDGPTVGHALAAHPDIAMISFTGSTRAGIQVAKDAADTVKRVAQELGGKSANIILPDADLESAVSAGVRACFANSGQSCNAPTRMLVSREKLGNALEIASSTANGILVGDPKDPATQMGPLANAAQFERVRAAISRAAREGAQVVAGGEAMPQGIDRGYFVRPTVFGGVHPDMAVAREEIFGPVLVVIPYDSVDHAISIANDSPYGLAAYVQSPDRAAAASVARRLQTGNVLLNGSMGVPAMPFGGFKQSGNGREWSVFGLEEYLELKAVVG